MFGSEKRQYRKFLALPDGISWEGKSYPFSQIRHLAYARVLTTQKLNLVEIGEAESSALEITVENGPRISLTFDEAGFFYGWNSSKKEDIKNLTDLYLYLAGHSFQYRLAHYLREIEEKGYFTVDECCLYPKDKIVFRRQEFPLATSNFLKIRGCIELRKKDYGFWDKVKRELSFTKIPQFNTCKDTDVVFTLLDKLMGLQWK
jgi:hypothetical protein